MKYLLIGLAVLVLNACNSAGDKKVNADTSTTVLEKRLADFMQYNDEMKLDKVLDYTYPKVFTIVPREQLKKSMVEGFNADGRTVDLDSMRVEKIHPIFQVENGSFAKIDYRMTLVMTFPTPVSPSTDTDSSSEIHFMKMMFEEKYGKENINLDKEKRVLSIRTKSSMVAIKDKDSEDWTFVNLSEDNPLINKLFNKEVIDRLGTYK